MVLGLALLISEILTPGGFFIFFFGIGGIFIGLIVYFFPNITLTNQIFLFSIFSIISLLIFRKPLQHLFQNRFGGVEEEIIGSEVVVIKAISPRQSGLVEFRGSPWKAVVDTNESLPKGINCRVTKICKLTFTVESLKN